MLVNSYGQLLLHGLVLAEGSGGFLTVAGASASLANCTLRHNGRSPGTGVPWTARALCDGRPAACPLARTPLFFSHEHDIIGDSVQG